jgi:hypothetical protein
MGRAMTMTEARRAARREAKSAIRKAREEDALAMLRESGRAPSPNRRDEAKIYNAFSTRVHVSPRYRARAERLGWRPREMWDDDTKAQALAFFIRHGRRPRSNADDPAERRLGQAWSSRMCKSNTLYDPDFVRRANEVMLPADRRL